MFKPLAVVPVFGETLRLRSVLTYLSSLSLDTLVVNDGNGPSLTFALEQEGYAVHDMGENTGVGAATKKGLAIAAERGYSGIISVDADGAHNEVSVASVFTMAEHSPDVPVLTSRFGHIGEIYIPESKRAANAFASDLFWAATGHRLPDVASGLRYYPASLSQQQWRCERFDFIYEILHFMLDADTDYNLVKTFVEYPNIGPWLTKANELKNLIDYCCSHKRLNEELVEALVPLRNEQSVLQIGYLTITVADSEYQFDALPGQLSYLITNRTEKHRYTPDVTIPNRDKISLGIIPDGGRRWAAKHNVSLLDSYIKTLDKIYGFLLANHNELGSMAIYCISLYNLSRSAPEIEALFDATRIFTDDLISAGFAPIFYGDLLSLPPNFQSYSLSINRQVSAEHKDRTVIVLCTAFTGAWQRWVLSAEGKPWDFMLSPEMLQKILRMRLALVFRTGDARTLSDFLPDASGYAVISIKKPLFNDVDLELWWQNELKKLSQAKYGT
jgi:undecaprenyl diphosphate synthase